MPTVICPSCQCKLRVPDQLADRQLICPGCHEIVQGPGPEAAYRGDRERAPPRDPAHASAEGELLSLPARLGAVAMFLGTLSVLVLCLPYVGYAALGLSGVGLLVGLAGLVSGYLQGAPAGGCAQRDRRFPLAGIAACLVALALTLLPFLFR
jgi:hypothetical protein